MTVQRGGTAAAAAGGARGTRRLGGPDGSQTGVHHAVAPLVRRLARGRRGGLPARRRGPHARVSRCRSGPRARHGGAIPGEAALPAAALPLPAPNLAAPPPPRLSFLIAKPS